MNIYRILTLISLLAIPHLSFAEYRDNNYQARLQDVMKARKLMDKKRERDKISCLLYTSPSPRDTERSRMPSSA